MCLENRGSSVYGRNQPEFEKKIKRHVPVAWMSEASDIKETTNEQKLILKKINKNQLVNKTLRFRKHYQLP